MKAKPANTIIIILAIASMGPYVFVRQGIRVDHFVIYGITAFFIIRNYKDYIFSKKPIFLQLFLVFFSILILIFLSRTIIERSYISIYKVFADLDNYLQPILISVLVYHCVKDFSLNESWQIFLTALKTIMILLSVNAMLAISSIFYGPWFIKYFNTSGYIDEGQKSVFDVATRGGRFSGIFNQPIEAGVAYGSVFLVLIFILDQKKRVKDLPISNSFLLLGFVFIIAGGILSVSKAFFPLAFGLAFILLFFFFGVSSRQLLKGVLMSTPIVMGFIYWVFSKWDAAFYFIRLVSIAKGQNLISLYTSGRFGGDNPGERVVQDRLNNPELFLGKGLGSIQTPDSALLELLYFGGVLSLMIYLLFFIYSYYYIFKYKIFNRRISNFLLFFLTFILLSGLGAPVFGMNRSNIIFIIFYILCHNILFKSRQIKSNV